MRPADASGADHVAVARRLRSPSDMTDAERDQNENPPIDESTYAGSASETGGLYDDSGPTIANPQGDTMSEEEERDERPAEGPSA